MADIKGNPMLSLKAGPFYTHELSYLCFMLQRLAGEAQGSANDVGVDDGDAPVAAESEPEDEDGFVQLEPYKKV